MGGPSCVVVRRAPPAVNFCSLALQWPQFWAHLHQTCSGCSSRQSLGQVRNWVRSGQKLGHQVYLQKNGISALAATDIAQSSPNLLRMFIWTFPRSSSKLGQIGSKTRSLGQIIEKRHQRSSSHNFIPIFTNLAQNIYLDIQKLCHYGCNMVWQTQL